MDKVQRAFARFMTKPDLMFENHLLVSMEISADENIPTAATDGHSVMKYNPKFFEPLTVKEIAGVLAHECWHKGKLHTFRAGNRPHHHLWNICVDYEANAAVRAAGHKQFELPGVPVSINEFLQILKTENVPDAFKNGSHFFDQQMIDASFVTAEQLYDKFEKYIPELDSVAARGGTGNLFDGDMDKDLQAESSAKAQAEGRTESQVKAETITDIMQAAKRAESRGNASAHAKLAGNMASDATVDWRRELRKWCTSHFNKNDWSFRRQNRQAIATGLILPTLHQESAGPIVVAVDTSGSCLHALPQFGAEVKALFKRINPSELIVLYADYEVCHVDRFTAFDQIHFTPHGGGGTSFKGPFKWLEKEKLRPDCLVYLTDMWGDFPEKAPKFPTMWAVTSNSDVLAPFGRRVRVDV